MKSGLNPSKCFIIILFLFLFIFLTSLTHMEDQAMRILVTEAVMITSKPSATITLNRNNECGLNPKTAHNRMWSKEE